MSTKITLIGAGSVIFAKTLIGDILQFPELSDATICLMDIDADRLRVADIMMKRVVEKLKIGAKVESTLDRTEAIRGAKYVICTIQVGGFRPSTVVDFEIPAKYGLKQTIADTLGIGGIFRALRTIPVLLDIARDIQDVAHPDCMFLNYTNPMAMNCWAVEEAVGIPMVGLCHSVFGTARMLASHANIPFSEVTYLVAGINHMAFFLNFKYRGQDAYPLLFQILNDPTRNYEKVRYEMMRRTGYFVTESSEHQAEYTPYFIHHGDERIAEFGVPINEYIRRCEAIEATWKSSEAKLIGDKGEIEVAPQSHEYGSYIVHSIETNTPRTIYGNVPNYGIIDNLYAGCCIEVPCLVDGNGLSPVRIGSLPPQLAALCSTNVNVQRLTVDAALTGKREHIYHAAMLDPHTAATLTLDQIWSMCDELIEAHQRDGFLGEFEPTIPNTGRSLAGVGDRIILRGRPLGLNLAEPESTFELEVIGENPGAEEVSVSGVVKSQSPDIEFAEPGFSLEIPAGAKVSQKLRGTVKARVENMVRVELETEDSRAFSVDAQLVPRRRLEVNEKGEASFSMSLSGFECATGTLWKENGDFRLRMTVKDSKVEARPDWPREGSSVQVFLSSDEHPGVRHYYLIPGEGDQAAVVGAGANRIGGASLEVQRSKSDYSLDFRIPFENACIPENGRFYFDVVIVLGALGEAHSGGTARLSRQGNSKGDMSNALEINL